MDATIDLSRKRIEEPGRYAITLECADDLTDSELTLLVEFFKAELFSSQNLIAATPRSGRLDSVHGLVFEEAHA